MNSTPRMEVFAGYLLGAFLPVAEVCRRRTDFSDVPTYVDDFIIGGILLFAARRVSKGHRDGPVLLVAAWALFCGGMYSSFFGQITHGGPDDVSGLQNGIVVAVKGIIWGIGIASLALSVRVSVRRQSPLDEGTGEANQS